MFGFTPPNMQDPQLQRSRQKLLTMEPSSRAIISTAAADSGFAANDALRQLKLGQIASDLQARQNQDTLVQENANKQMKFDTKAFDYSKKQNNIATLLAGAGLIPKAYMGYKAYEQSGKTAKDMMDLAKQIQDATGRIKIGGV